MHEIILSNQDATGTELSLMNENAPHMMGNLLNSNGKAAIVYIF